MQDRFVLWNKMEYECYNYMRYQRNFPIFKENQLIVVTNVDHKFIVYKNCMKFDIIEIEYEFIFEQSC